MIRLTYVALGCSMLVLAGCGDKPKPVDKPPPAKGEIREIWLQIDGMSAKLNIT